MANETLKALFAHSLRDVYFAENTILKELPRLAEAATDPALKEAFERHRAETAGQVKRLDTIFDMIGEKAEGAKCPAIEGLAEEARSITQAFAGNVLDAGLIGAAQAIEHYEIARYGTLRAWAEQLDLGEAVELLTETLGEEESTDDLLSELAEDIINPRAA